MNERLTKAMFNRGPRLTFQQSYIFHDVHDLRCKHGQHENKMYTPPPETPTDKFQFHSFSRPIHVYSFVLWSSPQFIDFICFDWFDLFYLATILRKQIACKKVRGFEPRTLQLRVRHGLIHWATRQLINIISLQSADMCYDIS